MFAFRMIYANARGEPMEDGIVNAYPTPELSRRARRALLACGLWLRVGFIGACGAALGLAQLLDGTMKPFPALALVIGGGVLAVVSWWRGHVVLDNADKPADTTAGAVAMSPPHRDRALAGT